MCMDPRVEIRVPGPAGRINSTRNACNLSHNQKSENGVFRRGLKKTGAAGFTPHTMIDTVRLVIEGDSQDRVFCHRPLICRGEDAALRCPRACARDNRLPDQAAPTCSPLSFPVFLASILTWIPGAASSHSGLSGVSVGGTNGRVSVSLAIRFASWSHRDSAGRNTSVDQPTNERTMGRSVSISCRQSSQAEI